MRTDAEHRALDERLDIFTWGLVIMALAVVLLIPGVQALWFYLLATGLVFVAMTVVRKVMRTRRDTEGMIAGVVLLSFGVLNLLGVDMRFFPVVPIVLLIVGAVLLALALASRRVRTDPDRPPE